MALFDDATPKVTKDIVAQKKGQLLETSQKKRLDLSEITTQLTGDAIVDGDGVLIDGVEHRLGTSQPGTNFDAYETREGKDAEWFSSPFNRAKMAKQKNSLAAELGINPKDVTDEMIFQRGEENRDYLRGLTEGKDTTITPIEEGFYGRPISEGRIDGASLVEAMQAPERNADYWSRWNTAGRNLGSEDPIPATPGDVIGDAATALLGGTIQQVGGAAYSLLDTVSRPLPGPSLDTMLREYNAHPEFTRSAQILDDWFLSPAGQQDRRLHAQRTEAFEQEAQARLAEAKGGLDTFNTHLLNFVEGAGVGISSMLDNPLTIVDALARSTPMLLTAAVTGKAAILGKVKKLTKGMSPAEARAFIQSETGQKAIRKTGERAGVAVNAVMEAASNYLDGKESVLGMSEAELQQTSDVYNQYRADGMSHEDAQLKTAQHNADISGGLTALSAGLITKVTGAGAFEGTLLAKTGKTGVKKAAGKALLDTGRETIEESAQSGSGEFIGNLATQLTSDKTQSLSERVGVATGEGAITGAGLGGGASIIGNTPAAALGVAEQAADVPEKVRKGKNKLRYRKDETPTAEYSDPEHQNYNPLRTINDLRDKYSEPKTTPEQKDQYLDEMKDHFTVLLDRRISALEAEHDGQAESKEVAEAQRMIHNLENIRRKERKEVNVRSMVKAALTNTEPLTDADLENLQNEIVFSATAHDYDGFPSLRAGVPLNENVPENLRALLNEAEALNEKLDKYAKQTKAKSLTQGLRQLYQSVPGFIVEKANKSISTGLNASPGAITWNIQQKKLEQAKAGIANLESYIKFQKDVINQQAKFELSKEDKAVYNRLRLQLPLMDAHVRFLKSQYNMAAQKEGQPELEAREAPKASKTPNDIPEATEAPQEPQKQSEEPPVDDFEPVDEREVDTTQQAAPPPKKKPFQPADTEKDVRRQKLKAVKTRNTKKGKLDYLEQLRRQYDRQAEATFSLNDTENIQKLQFLGQDIGAVEDYLLAEGFTREELGLQEETVEEESQEFVDEFENYDPAEASIEEDPYETADAEARRIASEENNWEYYNKVGQFKVLENALREKIKTRSIDPELGERAISILSRIEETHYSSNDASMKRLLLSLMDGGVAYSTQDGVNGYAHVPDEAIELLLAVYEHNYEEFKTAPPDLGEEGFDYQKMQDWNRGVVHAGGLVSQLESELIELDLAKKLGIKAPEKITEGVEFSVASFQWIDRKPGDTYSNYNLCHTTADHTVRRLRQAGLPAARENIGQADTAGVVENRLGDHRVALTEVDGIRYIVDQPQKELWKPLNPPQENKTEIITNQWKPRFIEVTAENLIEHYGYTPERAKSEVNSLKGGKLTPPLPTNAIEIVKQVRNGALEDAPKASPDVLRIPSLDGKQDAMEVDGFLWATYEAPLSEARMTKTKQLTWLTKRDEFYDYLENNPRIPDWLKEVGKTIQQYVPEYTVQEKNDLSKEEQQRSFTNREGNPTIRAYVTAYPTDREYDTANLSYDEILLSKLSPEGLAHTMLHEHIHIITVDPFHRKEDNRPLSSREEVFVASIKALYGEAKDQLSLDHYGLVNEREFIAEAFTNINFREELKQKKSGLKKEHTLFWRLLNAILEFLHLPTAQKNLLEATLDVTMEYLETQNEDVSPFIEMYEIEEDMARYWAETEGIVPDPKIDAHSETSAVPDVSDSPVDESRPEFSKLPAYKEGQKNMVYAGVGARNTPDSALKIMATVAKILEKKGYTLRSGGAKGADQAFESGVQDRANKQIFYANNANARTIQIAREIHPRPQALKEYPLKLMARNTNQVFGANLDSPVDFVIAYTPDGVTHHSQRTIKTGGTGQAIEMASRKGIPVINMADPKWEEQLIAIVGDPKEGKKPDGPKEKLQKEKDKKKAKKGVIPPALRSLKTFLKDAEKRLEQRIDEEEVVEKKKFSRSDYLHEVQREVTNLEGKIEDPLRKRLLTAIQAAFADKTMKLRGLKRDINKSLWAHRKFDLYNKTNISPKHQNTDFYRYLKTFAFITMGKSKDRQARKKLINQLLNDHYRKDLTDKQLDALASTTLNAIMDFYVEHGFPNATRSLFPTALTTNFNTSAEEFLGVRGKAQSLLGEIPDIRAIMEDTKARKKLFDLLELSKKERTQLTQFFEEVSKLANTLHTQVLLTPDQLNKDKRKEFFRDEDALSMLRQADGAMAEQIITAIAIGSLGWVYTRGKDTLYRDDKQINRFIGRPEDAYVPRELSTLLRTAGVILPETAEQLGGEIFRQLNLRGLSDAPGNMAPRVQLGLGKAAIGALAHQGLVSVTEIENNSLHPFRLDENGEFYKGLKHFPDTKIYLASITPEVNEWNGVKGPSLEVEALNTKLELMNDLLSKLFDMEGTRRGVRRTPSKSVPKNVKNANTKTSPAQRKAVKHSQQVKFVPIKRVVDLLDILPSETALKPMGLVTDFEELHSTQEDSARAKNAKMIRDYREFREYMGLEDAYDGFYYEYEIRSFGRMADNGRGLSYQNSKFHRGWVAPESWERTIDLSENSEELESLKLAILQGFGIEAPAGSNASRLATFHEQFMDGDGNILNHADGMLKKAITGIQKRELTDKGVLRKNYLDAIEAVANEGMYSLAMLSALAELSTALQEGKKEITIQGFREIDGTTNGPAMTLYQLGTAAAQEFTRRSGFIYKGDVGADGSYSFEKEKIGHDNYESFIREVQDEIVRLKNTGTDYEKRILNAMEYIVGPFEDVEKQITKPGRDYGKSPLMTSIYGSGIDGIMDVFGGVVVDNFYTLLMKGGKEYLEDQEAIALSTLFTHLKTILPMEFREKSVGDLLGEVKAQGARNWTLPMAKLSFQGGEYINNEGELIVMGPHTIYMPSNLALQKAVKQKYQKGFEKGLISILGSDFERTKTGLIAATRVMSEMFVAIYQTRADKVLAEKEGSYLTQDEKDEILEGMVKEGYYPAVGHYSSTSFEDSADLATREKVRMYGKDDARQKNFFQQPIPITNRSLVKGYAQVKEGEIATSSDHISEYVYVGNPGVRGFPLLTINMDANIMAVMMATEEMMNIFDAGGFRAGDSQKLAQKQNAVLLDIMLNYNEIEELEKTFDRLSKGAAANEVSPKQKKLLIARLLQSKMRVIDDKGEPQFYTHISKVYPEIKAVMRTAKINKRKLDRELVGTDHFPEGDHSAAFLKDRLEQVPTIAEVQAELLEEAEKSEEGHGSQPGAGQDINPEYSTLVSPQRIEQIFDNLAHIGNVEENITHETWLRELLHDVAKPALKTLSGVTAHIGQVRTPISTRGHETKGYAIGDSIYLGAAKGEVLFKSQMSAQEVFMHELFHRFWKAGLDGANPKLRRQVERLFNIAKREVKPEDFLREGAPRTDAEMEYAQQRYDFIFNTTKHPEGYLHEFASFGLTNEAFMKRLNQIQNKLPPEVPGTTFTGKLLRLFQKVMLWVSRTFTPGRHDTVGKSLESLAKDITNIQNGHQAKIDMAWSATVPAANEAFKKIVNRAAVQPYANYIQRQRLKKDRSKARRQFDAVLAAPYNLHQEGIGKKINKQMYDMGFDTDNPLYKLIQSIRGPDSISTPFHVLLRMNKALLDQRREAEASSYEQDITVHYDEKKPLTKKDWMHLTTALLKSDVSSIMGKYGVLDIVDFLQSRRKITQRMEQIEKKLVKDYGNNGKYYIKQAVSLGHYMATGRVLVGGQYFNAAAIADTRYRGRELRGDIDVATALIEELATLSALKFTDSGAKQTAARIMMHENSRQLPDGEENGVSFMLKAHMDIKKRAYLENFEKDSFLMQKGYIHELFDPYTDFIVDTEARADALKRDGYENMGPIQPDPDISFQKRLRIYVNPIGGMQRRQTGSFGLTNTRMKGFNMMSLYMQHSQSPNPAQTARHNFFNVLLKRDNADIDAQFNGTAQYQFNENLMVPLYSPNGRKIINYRYQMSEEAKLNLLGMQNLAPQVLARMSGAIIDKTQTTRNNEAVFKVVQEDFQEHFEDEPRAFVAIGPDVENPKHKEIYDLMPANTKRIFHTMFPSGEMMIRQDQIDIVFGFRKGSITDWMDFKLKERYGEEHGLNPHLRRGMKTAGLIWEYMVARMKRNVVIFVPDVLINNVLSNQMLLWWHDVPPAESFRLAKEALSELTHYQLDVKKKMKMERALRLNPNHPRKASIERQIERVTQTIEKNPVHPLVQGGLFQSITEDIAEDTGKLEDAILRLLPGSLEKKEKALEAVPDFAKEAYKQTVMTPDTAGSQILTKATQYSDFVARYVLYKHQTEKQGMDPEASINYIVEVFINYDAPDSVQLQWMNDMGLILFTKFGLRILRIAFRMLKERPATAAAVGGIETLTGVDLPGIIGDNILANGPNIPLLDPGEALQTTFAANLYNVMEGYLNPF